MSKNEGSYTASDEEIIKSIAEVLRTSSGETIEKAAHAVGLTSVKYTGDSMFEVGQNDYHTVVVNV